MFAIFIVLFSIFWCMKSLKCAVLTPRREHVICSELPEMILEEILGAAFNPRYMSISEPITVANVDKNGKRRTADEEEFYVDDFYYEQVAEDPAWDVKNHAHISALTSKRRRYKREINYMQEWHCRAKIIWTDLGPEYFPRYLRSVECLSTNCWFNVYKCKPRSFTVKILKRKIDRCVVAEPGTRIGTLGLPRDLKELWVWEERAVAFCCDCTYA